MCDSLSAVTPQSIASTRPPIISLTLAPTRCTPSMRPSCASQMTLTKPSFSPAATALPFDANWHQALMSEPAEDCEPGTVTAVLQKGYKLKDRLLRAAMVKISE